nr:protein psiB [Rhizobium sp. Q54]
MTTTATVYLLDPEAGTIQAAEVAAPSAFSQTYGLIGCQLVEVVPLDTNHVLIVDEEGLRDGLTAFTVFDGYPQPLAGKIVLASLDGSHVLSPQISIEEAAARLNVCKPVLDPVFAKADEHSPNGVILGGALIGFQTRITRTHPTVMAGVVR